MAWRYTTIDCVRVWQFYRHVGPAEIARSIVWPCSRAGALALPLLAGPAVATLPARALAPVLPLIGQPDAFGGGAYALGGPGFGFGDAGYAPFGSGFGAGGFGPSPSDREVPALGIAGVSAAPGRAARDVGTHVQPSAPSAGSGHLLGNTEQLDVAPQPVPEPSSLAVLFLPVVGILFWRRRV